MNLHWVIEDSDVQRVKDLLTESIGSFLDIRRERNILKQNISLDKDAIIRAMVMCLLTTQQRSGPNSRIAKFLNLNPFPITYKGIHRAYYPGKYIQDILIKYGLNRYINKIPKFFAKNLAYLEDQEWKLNNDLSKLAEGESNASLERETADHIAMIFDGFGPKQARNFLQSLGLTKYEIPIDSRITKWLNKFGFPITLSSTALQDTAYYHFVSDGIQLLCKKTGIYPCILDAAIFSSIDKDKWSKENMVF